ncbi:MAG: glutamine--fructose-6-phosphate transaminase (isomerizing) [Verrucomicrobiota bacterium]|nr:glutamine--fructose-6-phosphate transaminase (isomerizing) [Verrucomicrobiota bacterium]
MCGILGYIGNREASPLLVEGLRRLEYRGYDSSGISVLNGKIHTRKKKGRIDALAELLKSDPVQGTIGISHTRWATHGEPSDANSHPHADQSGHLSLVHNGVIENYISLREQLEKKGNNFKSSTDTEVLSHLIGYFYNLSTDPSGVERLVGAVKSALLEVVGTYGIALVHEDCPGVIIGARRGSPLLVGVGDGENFLASDVSAIIRHTSSVVYLNDYDLVTVKRDGYSIDSLTSSEKQERMISKIDWKPDAAEKGEFAHYMLKEIFEQPESLENALRGRLIHEDATVRFGGLNLTMGELRSVDRIIFSACGSAWHAAMVGEYLIESLARIPVEVEYASEFRYRNPPIDKNTLVFVISQSGETADTLAALRESKRKGHRSLAVVNVVGSTIAREAEGGIYMRAGPEVGVAATKSFTSQVTILTMVGLLMGRIRHLSFSEGKKILDGLQALPELMRRVLESNDHIKDIAKKYQSFESFMFLGRQMNFPVALEGALKLKEISYLHAQAFPSGEIKHGPIALIDKETVSIFLAPQDDVYEKNLSNLQEIKARGGQTIAVTTTGDTHLEKLADDVIYVPKVEPWLQPVLNTIPLQLLSYHIAVMRGCDVDKPRNLAKSVTVE